MLQLGSSTDMFMLALVSYVAIAWPALISGFIVGVRNSLFLEMLVITLIGGVASVAWMYLSGFVELSSESLAVIGAVSFYIGGVIGGLLGYGVRTLRRQLDAGK